MMTSTYVPDTAMSAAFARAGLPSAAERLRRLAAEARARHPRHVEAQKDMFFAAIRDDADLLWEFFAPFRIDAARRIFAAVPAEPSAREGSSRAVPPSMAIGLMTPSRAPETTNRAGEARFLVSDPRSTLAMSPPHDPTPNHAAGAKEVMSPAGSLPSMRRPRDPGGRIQFAAQTILDTFLINNRALRHVTAREANEWARSRARDAAFVRLVTANLPPDSPIGDFITADEATRLYQMAKEHAGD